MIGAGRLDVHGTFDQSPVSAHLEVRDGGSSNIFDNAGFKSRIVVENGLLELAPNKTFTLSDNARIDMVQASGKLKIGDYSTLVLSGRNTLLNLQKAGSKVYLGRNSAIEIRSGATIDARGVTFTALSGSTAPADRWKHIKLFTNNNTFTDCILQNAQQAIYLASSAGYGNLIDRSTLRNNGVGVYINGGETTVQGTNIHSGDYGILVRGDGTVFTTAYYENGFTDMEIRAVSTGIRIFDYGAAYVKLTRFDDTNYHVSLSGEGRLYAGWNDWASPYSWDWGLDGYNSFLWAADKDIYNAAYTSGGSSITAEARYNWWNAITTGYPSSGRFYGSVDRAYPLSCDPTYDGVYCSSVEEDEGGCSYCYSAGGQPSAQLQLKSGTDISNTTSASAAPTEKQLKQHLTGLLSKIEERPEPRSSRHRSLAT